MTFLYVTNDYKEKNDRRKKHRRRKNHDDDKNKKLIKNGRDAEKEKKCFAFSDDIPILYYDPRQNEWEIIFGMR